MALTRTAGDLTADVRNRTDHKIGTFRTDANIYRYLSESCRSLVLRLSLEYDVLDWCALGAIIVVSGNNSGSLPNACWKTIKADVLLEGRRVKIEKADLDEIGLEATVGTGWSAADPPRMRIIGRTAWFSKYATAAFHQVNLFYLTNNIFLDSTDVAKTELTVATDKFDGIAGWESWVVLDAAIKLLSDEGKDTSGLEREQAKRWEEIVAAAAGEHAERPERVRDTYRAGDRGNNYDPELW